MKWTIHVKGVDDSMYNVEVEESKFQGYTISCLINDIERLSGHKFDEKGWQLVFKDSPLQDWSLTLKTCGIERDDTLFIQPLGFAVNIFNPEVDVCFMVDCTASMGSHIANVKNYVLKFRSHLQEKYVKCDLRFAFVRYTDYDLTERTTFLKFTKDHSSFDSFVGNVTARGGGDAAEDVMGGLKAVFQLSWRRRAAKVLIHIADAPCHGKIYHDVGDSYPDGDKDGLTHEQMIDKVNEHSVDYWFGYIYRDVTDKMISIFNEYLQQVSNKTLLIRQFDATEKPFLSFNRCIYTTVTASEVTTKVYDEEKEAFCEWINQKLKGDVEVSKYLPIPKEGRGLFKALSDGVLLCKLINDSAPGTVDERTINKGQLDDARIRENLMLALNSASSLGCNITNVSLLDIIAGRPYHILELLWQIFKNGLFSQISIDRYPNLSALVTKEEGLHTLAVIPKEEILLRWFNYHLEQAGFKGRVNNFSSDIMDSTCYTALLVQTSLPGVEIDESHLVEKDVEVRAEKMLKQAEKILDGQRLLQPKDVVTGNTRLNIAFVGNIFNKNPALKSTESHASAEAAGEPQEEKGYRNWMNSMGVSPYVNNLYSDLTDGLVLLQLFDKMNPGIVDWSKVNKKETYVAVGGKMKKIENCNYAMKIAKQMQLSTVGIDGYNIHDGNKKGILALVSQMMSAYTMSVLQRLTGSDKPISDKDIIAWVNATLSGARKTSKIESFKDPVISTSIPVIDLVDAIKSGSIRYEVVKQGESLSEEEKLQNAKYAVSMCQKIGATVYILPDDLVKGKVKLRRMVFACLMTRGKV